MSELIDKSDYEKDNKARRFILDNKCDDLILNRCDDISPEQRIYVSDLLRSYVSQIQKENEELREAVNKN